MALLKDIISKIVGREEEPEEQLSDDETRDKYLRSLRREKRVQMEEVEKEQLKKEIAEFNKERMKKHLFGIKGGIEAKKEMIGKLKQKKEVKALGQHFNILKQKQTTKAKADILHNKMRFF